MYVKKEISLRDFDFWSGAKAWADLLTDDELDTIEEALASADDDCLTDTQINDFLWFDTEIWLEWIGKTEDEILAREKENDAQRDYDAAQDYQNYCALYEPSYNPEDGSM